MATRAKKSRTKSGGSTGKKRGGAKSRGGTKTAKTAKKAAAKRGPARKSSMKKAVKKSRGPALKKSAKRAAKVVKRAAKRSSGARKSGGSALSRVTRVAKEVAHQATTAVSEGVETIKEFGEGMMDRVTG